MKNKNFNYYNIIAKGLKGQEYIMVDMIATKLTRKQFEKLQANNDFLKEYYYIPYSETDFTWWTKVNKYLTNRRLTTGWTFCIDYWGNITKY